MERRIAQRDSPRQMSERMPLETQGSPCRCGQPDPPPPSPSPGGPDLPRREHRQPHRHRRGGGPAPGAAVVRAQAVLREQRRVDGQVGRGDAQDVLQVAEAGTQVQHQPPEAIRHGAAAHEVRGGRALGGGS